jgi:hypothetical protein
MQQSLLLQLNLLHPRKTHLVLLHRLQVSVGFPSTSLCICV